MATDKICQCYVLFSLLGIFHALTFVSSACLSPLGMENGKIKDSQITVSSVFRNRNTGGEARLRQNIGPWGAWCPNTTGGSTTVTMFEQYIQIALLNLTKVTRVATQGREYNRGAEFVKEYKISHSQDGSTWTFYHGKNKAKEAKIFKGNKDVSSVVANDLNPAVTVRYIRVHPGYKRGTIVCIRLELYGCVSGENEKVILSYSMPIGQKTKNGKIQYIDTFYSGVISNNFYKGGTGILTDGELGSVNAKELQGKGWVGWSTTFTKSQYIPITFEFSGVRKFKDVTITVNVNKNRHHAVFNKSQIFFSSVENHFSDTSFLKYCPSVMSVNVDQFNTNITMSLCENTAKFLKMQLFFDGKWLLITEISFNSVPAGADEKQSLQKCSGDTLASCSVTRSSTEILPTGSTPRPACKDCTTERTSTPGPEVKTKSSIVTESSIRTVTVTKNLNTPVIVAIVVSLVILFIIVFGILEYKRRRQASQMTTSASIPEEKAELRPLTPIDVVTEPSRNIQDEDYETPAISDLEPHYEEVPISSLSVYTNLHRNKQGGIEASDDNTYQKLLKQYTENVIPVDCGSGSYEEVKIPSPPGYTELDKNKQDESTTNNDDNYQKLLKPNPDEDYAIPADTGTEPYEEIGGYQTVSGYKELDNKKRELDNNASYQKLTKN